ncbi:MAG: hypothetical protein CML29_17420 [Rhizobiales bacterium]|nr:hypothetical protein [Hyphomicrobiales bacterium]MBA68638.1 hypothetical protein [Hyphomicrobiales bacterium]
MSAQITIDASDYLAKSRAIARLPAEIKAKAFRRAFGHTRRKALTQVSRKLAEYTGLPYRVVRPKAHLGISLEDIEIRVKSGWIPLIDLAGVRATKRKGVYTRTRGSYRAAWIASMQRGRGVFVREGKERGPVDELFGPNPAHALGEDRQGEFDRLASEIIERDLADRVIHELNRILAKV